MSQSHPPCPLKAAHKRLLDCHVHWHDMADHYMDPESFRLKLNALIQELRNVTFVLQKQKSHLRSYDEWYIEWQNAAKADEVMRWIVSARNRIVKEADLGILSLAKARYIVDWATEYQRVFDVEPRLSMRQIASMVLRQVDGREGVLRVERVWVDCKLPDRELLEATAYALDNLRKLIFRAHEAQDITNCDVLGRERDYSCVRGGAEGLRSGYACLEQDYSNKTLEISLDDLSEYRSIQEVIKLDSKKMADAVAHYGDPSPLMRGDPIEAITGLSEMAKVVLSHDGYHMFLIFLYSGERVIHMEETMPPDHNGKYVLMARIADVVARSGADGIVTISESWTAEGLKTSPFTGRLMRASERGDRSEVLTVSAATADGRSRQLITSFTRDEQEKIMLGDTVDEGSLEGLNLFLEPVLRLWRNQPGK